MIACNMYAFSVPLLTQTSHWHPLCAICRFLQGAAVPLAAAVFIAFLGSVIAPSPAHAICDEPRVIFQFSKARTSRLLSNLRSDWAEAGAIITYTKLMEGVLTPEAVGNDFIEGRAHPGSYDLLMPR